MSGTISMRLLHRQPPGQSESFCHVAVSMIAAAHSVLLTSFGVTSGCAYATCACSILYLHVIRLTHHIASLW